MPQLRVHWPPLRDLCGALGKPLRPRAVPAPPRPRLHVWGILKWRRAQCRSIGDKLLWIRH
eukprot:4296737-Pyramimonas_sp.AAC.1